MCTEKCFELTQGAAAARRPGSGVSRRVALVGGAAMAATAALGGVAEAGERGHGFPGRGRRHGLVDLTHTLTTSFPAFAPGEEAQRKTVVTIEDDGYYIQQWTIIEHIGTHVDAPGHFTPGGRLSPELRPEELVVEAVVIDIADRAARDPDTVVTVDDLRVAPAPPGDPQPRGRHPQHRPGELDHVRDPPDPHRRRPLRAGEPEQPRPDPQARGHGRRRPHPLRGGLGRPGPHPRLLVTG